MCLHIELLVPDGLCGELHLDEAEPGCWLLLILGAQLDLDRCRRGVLTNLLMPVRHCEKIGAAQEMRIRLSQLARRG